MMELYGRSIGRNGSQTDHNQQSDWISMGPETGVEESMRRLGLWGERGGEFYPERPGMADCAYYIRTGSCGYGGKCRYNHPRDRSISAEGAARNVGGGYYPERPGEPPCQYYLRTNSCKFGASCKFHHPRNAGGSLSNVPLNTYGYPLRPDEKECSYYLKTGQCKFGITCKFHHPQPAGGSIPASARPFYSTSSPEQYRVARPPLVPGSYMPGAYGPILLSPGMVSLPNWSPYSGPVSPVISPGAASLYGMNSSAPPPFAAPYPSISTQTRRVFPERPGQPECQYYMKTGDCKFGSSCKYHHPSDLVVSKTDCVFSSMGLPLRPGVEPCNFYMRNGHCKFGHTCKFDHPMPSSSSPSLHPMPPFSELIQRSITDPYLTTHARNTSSSSDDVQISRSSSR